jgi:hypothetical protein
MDSFRLDGFAYALAGRLSRRAALRRGGEALAATALAAGVARVGHAHAQTTPAGTDPAAVVRAYIAAVNAHDLAAILAVYAPAAVHVVFPPAPGASGIYAGRAQIRTFYEAAIVNRDHLVVVPGTLQVKGNTVTYVKRIASGPWLKLGLGTLDANIYAVVEGNQFAAYIAMITPRDVARLFAATGVIPAAGTTAAASPAP